MIFCHPEIADRINVSNGFINTVIIENQILFLSLIEDITMQIEGQKGISVLGNDNNILQFSKNAEIITSFVPFDINQKSLINKIIASVEKEAVNSVFYEHTTQILSDIEKYMQDIVSDFDCNLIFTKISHSSLIKSSGIEIANDFNNLCEKILTYFALVREFDCDKLFITVNLRSYIDDEDIEYFTKTLLLHQYQVLMIENKEYSRFSSEKRITIDKDLCEF